MVQVLGMIHKKLSVKLLEKDALKRNKLFFLDLCITGELN